MRDGTNGGNCYHKNKMAAHASKMAEVSHKMADATSDCILGVAVYFSAGSQIS